ncbi:MAG: hypothetical protein ACYC3L_03875 [Gemmatimonadaceae bacterium]
MILRPVVRRTLLAFAVLFLLVVAWVSLAGGLRQTSQAHSLGQQAETAVQLVCGVLSLLGVITCIWWRGWSARVHMAWAIALTMTAGLSAVVWGPPDLVVGLIGAALTFLVALGVIRMLRVGLAR